MERHVTFVGALQIGYNAFGILAAMATFMFIVGGGLVVGLVSGEEGVVIPITFFVGTAISMWLLLLSVPGIVGGIGVLRHQSWARYLVLVLSILDLASVPIGTAVGAYSIWVLVQDETEKLFDSGDA
jgi:hypothetical protein